MVSKRLRALNMGLVSRLREAEDPGDEDAVYGILAALFLALPAAVRKTDPASLLRANGYCFVRDGAALHINGDTKAPPEDLARNTDHLLSRPIFAWLRYSRTKGVQAVSLT